jgi:hypothetical protein
MSTAIQKTNMGLLVVLIFMFIILLYFTILQDIEDGKTLDSIVCHKEINIPDIKCIDILVIESVIENYRKKRAMNKSGYAKVWGDVKNGFIRGAFGGMILGNGIEGAIPGSIVFGLLSGLLKAHSIVYGESSFLNLKKHT